ncbi:MAG: hypothetical protein D6719_11770, partial [Candidatus Dadabacteria bacterium]
MTFVAILAGFFKYTAADKPGRWPERLLGFIALLYGVSGLSALLPFCIIFLYYRSVLFRLKYLKASMPYVGLLLIW